MSDEPEKKTVQVTLSVKTGVDNFELCNFVEKVLQNSTLNSAIYELEITETKVTKSEKV